MRKRDPIATIGIVIAAALFAFTFRGPRAKFWERMTLTGFVLGNMALGNERELRHLRVRPIDIVQGLGSAAILYNIFFLGDQLARRLMPRGSQEIRDIYGLRTVAPKAEIATRLTTVIGPAEELFWRGFVQRRAGGLAAAAAYGGVHVVTGNATLIGAAAIAGIYWGLLRRLGMSMPALITSHVAWDIWIFLLAPTEGAEEETRPGVAPLP